MTKGEDTKLMIFEVALEIVSKIGFDKMSIGMLAKAVKMSKSGLFAHFQSKENLQKQIIEYAGRLFSEGVVVPALKVEAGIPRIRALVNNWIHQTSRMVGGCVFVQAANDFMDRPGKVRDCLLQQQQSWIDCLRRIAQSAINAGHFHKEIDCNQFAFELYSLLLGFHYYYRLLKNEDIRARQQKALDALIKRYQ